MKTPSHSHRSGSTRSSRLIKFVTRNPDSVWLLASRLRLLLLVIDSKEPVGSISGGR